MKKLIAVLALSAVVAWGQGGQVVRVTTNLGNIDIEMLPNSAPGTVQAFLRYVEKGAYNGTFFHRLVRGFVLQGGGYRVQNGSIVKIPNDGKLRNEYSASNVRGTLAMAKLDGDPNSATTEWFFNLADNSSNLNAQNGGFTVFARVANTASLGVLDQLTGPAIGIGAVADLDSVPFTGSALQESNLLVIRSMELLERPAVAGLVTASAFGGFNYAAPGSFIEIYGSNLSAVTRGWAESDFRGGRAPSSLEGVSVTVGGIPGYVTYVSPGQVNAQVPTGVFPGNANVVVNLRGQTINTTFRIRERAPGLLAPASFKNGDKQFVAAVRPNGTLVTNGSIPGIAAAPAVPGETLLFYGTGFGPVTPPSISIAGQIVTGTTALTGTVEFKFGDVAVKPVFAGLAPGLVGVYQFNVVIPEVADGDVPLAVTLDGAAVEQTLFLPVKK